MISLEEKFSSRCIQHVIEKLDANGVKWWVDHGSLLGIVRDNQLIPWDSDVDLGAMCDDHDVIHKIASNLACDFEYVSYNYLTNAISVRLYDIRQSQYWSIDIVFYTRSGEKAVKYYVDTEKRFGRIMGRLLTILSGDLAPVTDKKIINWMMVRLRVIHKAIPCWIMAPAAACIARLTPRRKNEVNAFYFKRIERKLTPYGVLCFPCYSKEYLEQRYGADWGTPKREWNFLLDDRCTD